MNPLRNIGQPTMMFITCPINTAKFTSVTYCTSRNQTYAHLTARYSFCSGQSPYVQCWVQTQQHVPTYSVMNCLLKSIASVMMVLYITPTVCGPQWVLQWFIMNLLNLFCPTICTSLFMLSTALLRSHCKNHCLPLIYAMHVDFSPILSVIINISYITLVEDVRRKGEYCISQQSDKNEDSLWMVVLKRKSRETKWPWTVSYWQLFAMLRESHISKFQEVILVRQNSHSNTWSLQHLILSTLIILSVKLFVFGVSEICFHYTSGILMETVWLTSAVPLSRNRFCITTERKCRGQL